jgi:cation diffusion facilitator CzcD-associated flavoprotein CzcO
MAPDTAHITMLQRSPSYIFSVPGFDRMSQVMQRFLPQSWVYRFARWRNITLQRWIYKAARRWPQRVRAMLLAGVRKQLGKDFDMRHFTPKYMPWDERLCAVPDADLFQAIKAGKASVVTDQIETFTERGILLKSGTELEADIIVTATGLQVQTFGGAEVTIDGQSRPVNQLMMYKSVMVQDVPNLALIVGYTNAPWTLKADIASRYICRLLQHMRRNGLAVATARAPEGMMGDESIFGALNSGYVRRAAESLPRQGKALPWRVLHNYEVDRVTLLDDPVDDGVLSFTAAPAGPAQPRVEMAAA